VYGGALLPAGRAATGPRRGGTSPGAGAHPLRSLAPRASERAWLPCGAAPARGGCRPADRVAGPGRLLGVPALPRSRPSPWPALLELRHGLGAARPLRPGRPSRAARPARRARGADLPLHARFGGARRPRRLQGGPLSARAPLAAPGAGAVPRGLPRGPCALPPRRTAEQWRPPRPRAGSVDDGRAPLLAWSAPARHLLPGGGAARGRPAAPHGTHRSALARPRPPRSRPFVARPPEGDAQRVRRGSGGGPARRRAGGRGRRRLRLGHPGAQRSGRTARRRARRARRRPARPPRPTGPQRGGSGLLAGGRWPACHHRPLLALCRPTA